MVMTDSDLAAAVRDAAKKRMEDGEIKPTLRDGLNAQSLLDRRDEKQKDRNFMLSLARLTSGSEHEVPKEIIEGHIVPDFAAIPEGDTPAEDSDFALQGPPESEDEDEPDG